MSFKGRLFNVWRRPLRDVSECPLNDVIEATFVWCFQQRLTDAKNCRYLTLNVVVEAELEASLDEIYCLEKVTENMSKEISSLQSQLEKDKNREVELSKEA